MPKLTLIARVVDGLPLAASMEEEKDHRELDAYKSQAKRIVKQLNAASPQRMTIEAGANNFHYINSDGVCFLCLTERAYPKRLAFNYLDDLYKEFMAKFRSDIESASRPYAFIKFDTFIQKTKKLYVDTRAPRNLSKLNDDLTDLTKIMTQNIQDVLGRGEMIDSVAKKSTSLRQASSKYSKDAKYLNTQALLRKYAPVAVVTVLIGGGLWWRFF
mmetsp:Transcript_29095/g.93795  ORF Transcript_29095/g.93795 Transcript_29095/m.93795 type:complete len:215 (+) Transcript_29095:26-670(+)